MTTYYTSKHTNGVAFAVALGLSAVVPFAQAQTPLMDHTRAMPGMASPAAGGAATPGSTAAASSAMTDGEVRRVDRESGRVTLRHGEIKNLDMPGMTMVFQVKDKAMLDGLQAGDKVRFTASQDAGRFMVDRLEKAP